MQAMQAMQQQAAMYANPQQAAIYQVRNRHNLQPLERCSGVCLPSTRLCADARLLGTCRA